MLTNSRRPMVRKVEISNNSAKRMASRRHIRRIARAGDYFPIDASLSNPVFRKMKSTMQPNTNILCDENNRMFRRPISTKSDDERPRIEKVVYPPFYLQPDRPISHQVLDSIIKKVAYEAPKSRRTAGDGTSEPSQLDKANAAFVNGPVQNTHVGEGQNGVGADAQSFHAAVGAAVLAMAQSMQNQGSVNGTTQNGGASGQTESFNPAAVGAAVTAFLREFQSQTGAIEQPKQPSPVPQKAAETQPVQSPVEFIDRLDAETRRGNLTLNNSIKPVSWLRGGSSQGELGPGDATPTNYFRTIKVEVPTSDRVAIVGNTAHARFLAHSFASTGKRGALSMFVRHPRVLTQWGDEDRTLVLYNAKGKKVSSATFECPTLVFDRRLRYRIPADTDYFDNLIIDTTSAAVVPCIRRLSDRIDRRTTIVLMHPGLGLVKQINEVVFYARDPADRPNYVVCHSTYVIEKVQHRMFSVQEKEKGALYMCAVPKFEGEEANSLPAIESRQYMQHIMDMICRNKALKAIQVDWPQLLKVKLTWIVFCSLADAISVVLGCKYNQIRFNSYAQDLWENLLAESVRIVAALPELQPHPEIVQSFTAPSFRRKMRMYLVSRHRNDSPWVARVRKGNYPPIDYFNGYLVQRAEELGLDHKHNSFVIGVVKARANARRAELRMDIPLGASPYMGDSDTIGGGQPRPSMDALVGLEDL